MPCTLGLLSADGGASAPGDSAIKSAKAVPAFLRKQLSRFDRKLAAPGGGPPGPPARRLPPPLVSRRARSRLDRAVRRRRMVQQSPAVLIASAVSGSRPHNVRARLQSGSGRPRQRSGATSRSGTLPPRLQSGPGRRSSRDSGAARLRSGSGRPARKEVSGRRGWNGGGGCGCRGRRVRRRGGRR